MAILSLYNLLRVLHIFIMDELFKTSFGFPDLVDIVFPANNDFVNSTLSAIELVFCSSSCLFFLPARCIWMIYFHLVSVFIVYLSYSANIKTLEAVLNEKYKNIEINPFDKDISWNAEELSNVITEIQVRQFEDRNFKLQFYLLLVFHFLQYFTTNQAIHKAFVFSFIFPTLTIAFLPGTWIHKFLNTVAILPTLWPLFIMLKTLWLDIFTITNLIRNKYSRIRVTINNYRINNLLHLVVNVVEVLEVEWNRLNISSVLLMFWVLRVLEQILYLITDIEIQNTTLFEVLQNVLIQGCDTFIAVLGMTSFVSYFFHYIGAFFQWLLLTDDVYDKSIGKLTAVLFYILALQSGLTGLDSEKRFISLYHNVCLLCAVLLHYIHYVVNPLLIMSLSAPSVNRHIRALIVCGFIIVYPITMFTYLLSHHSLIKWILAVSFFNIEIIIKVLVSLAVYSLFLFDAYRTTFWKKLDDYVYYIKLSSYTVEFCFGIFLFLNGVYIMAFLSGGAVCAFMMCIYALFNIFDVRNGWKVFVKCHTAVKKIESLPDATSVQLSEFEDVCAICYQNMGSAKITECNHYFHGVCLRKWFYVQDRCPLCHDTRQKRQMSKHKIQTAFKIFKMLLMLIILSYF